MKAELKSSMKSTQRIPEISSRHCLAVLLYTNSPLVGLRQGSAGATMVQSFSENVLEPGRTKNTHGGYRCRLKSLVNYSLFTPQRLDSSINSV